MIVVQATIKDSAENVGRFIRRNLAGGADHLVVFLDARAPDVEELLRAHEHVTCVRAYGKWWAGERPPNLNTRQSINATLTARLLAEVDWADWLFHVDGDESVFLERTALAALPADQPGVLLRPLEVASHPQLTGEPVWFKRGIERDEVALLRMLGVVERGRNGRYFRGHTTGKVGVRPSSGLFLGIHQVLDQTGAEVVVPTDQSLRVLHYESETREEFIRKWLALKSSGPLVRQRRKREALGAAIAALLAQDLGEEETRHFLGVLYDRTAVDDVESLRRLGMLVHIDLERAPVQAERLSDQARAQLETMLRRARGRAVAKDRFHPRARGDDLDEVVSSLRWDAPDG
jgi:Glycosyl transferase family 2